MDANSRKKKIAETLKVSSNQKGTIRLPIDNQELLLCYNVPVKFLVFNQYNGRIGSFVSTYEKTDGPLDASKPEGERIIMNLLWKAHKHDNERTLKDIKEKGQLEPGVITQDGVIVDGNRRCMMLKKLAEKEKIKPTSFNCAVLPFTINDNPQKIRELETLMQYRDAKVDYGPIEKYLTCERLTEDGCSTAEIAFLMNERNGKRAVKENLGILRLMKLFLQHIGADGMYEFLTVKKLEGPFFDMYKYLASKSVERNWDPSNIDEIDLQIILFDFIRARYTKEIRPIIKKAFNDGSAWKKIAKNHKEKIRPINKRQQPLAKNKKLSIELIEQREAAWKTEAGEANKQSGPICDIMSEALEDLKRKELLDRPLKLLGRIRDDLQTLLNDSHSLTSANEKRTLSEIQKLVSKLNKK